MKILKNWALINNVFLREFCSLEPICVRKTYLKGEVYNSENFKDGDRIYTSHIKGIIHSDKGIKIQTQNNIYLLETPLEEFRLYMLRTHRVFNLNDYLSKWAETFNGKENCKNSV